FGRREDADVRLVRAELSARGIDMRIAVRGDEFDVHSMLVGGFNVENVNAALAAGVALGIPVGTLQRAMARQKAIPGRLESYPLKSGATALIDYAHTPDALEKALQAAREITRNRLWVVFGCGGDRDRGKRPLMARVAERQADLTVVTDDNPRTEDPRRIITDIMAGFEQKEKIEVIRDRKEAITHVVKNAVSGDVLLVAGKGHENYQIIGKEKVPFDEVAIIKEADLHA
ncbi:MAG TPA: UDP-N-acetylmuramyl-tripeptide synthetase, partial [Caldithrix abyssi]|nr:UDP-N-acetylmuramyl-tripeptide synthetase [Caldithrix abyssi]